MKTIDDYMRTPYPMEVIEDQEGAALSFHFQTFQAVSPAEKR